MPRKGPNIVSDARRASARKHALRVVTCDCGKQCPDNDGWSSHERACGVLAALRAAQLATSTTIEAHA